MQPTDAYEVKKPNREPELKTENGAPARPSVRAKAAPARYRQKNYDTQAYPESTRYEKRSSPNSSVRWRHVFFDINVNADSLLRRIVRYAVDRSSQEPCARSHYVPAVLIDYSVEDTAT